MQNTVQPLLGSSEAIRHLLDEGRAIAPTDSQVLIMGESGVGKELLARFIHHRSLRSRAPMVTINCAGVAETLLESELFGHVRGSFTDAHRDRRGLFEVAHGGTVLMREVGEMSMRMQSLLLRFLDKGEIHRIGSDRFQTIVDVRLISATNSNLFEHTQRKAFREDLYYRLNVVCLIIPPLRSRREDIGLLLDHYLTAMSELLDASPARLTPEAIACLESYDWPGNVRELKNIVERIALQYAGRVVGVDDLPAQIAQREAPEAPAEAAARLQNAIAATYYDRITNGHESFWSVVYEPFMRHDVTRDIVRAVVRRALDDTRGNYRLVAQLFNLLPSDYRRFMNFLRKHQCHLPFQHFRALPSRLDRGQATDSAQVITGQSDRWVG